MLLETLFDNLALEVKPFATCRVAKDWRLLLPRRDWVTLHYILGGNGEMIPASGEIRPLHVHTLALMPPDYKHAVQCGSADHVASFEGQGDPEAPLCELVAGPLSEVDMTIACGLIQVNYLGGMGIFDYMKEAIVLDFDDSPRMTSIFQSLIDEYQRSGPACAAMMMALMNQCLIEVLRRASEETDGALPWLSALEDQRLSRVVETILDHPENPHTVDGLADVAHMSRSTFARHFEKCFGRTPMDYVRDVRLRRGAQLLRRAGLSLDNVARNSGFASRSHFSRAFQKQYGCAPTEFRKQQG